MNRISRTSALLLALTSFAACANGPAQQPAAPAAAGETRSREDLSGAWHGTLTDPQGMSHPIDLVFVRSGSELTGTMQGGPPDGSSQSIRNGKADGNKLAFEIVFKGPQGEAVTLCFEGTLQDDRIRGVHGMARMPLDFVWEARRQ